jgi:hypothetical protein
MYILQLVVCNSYRHNGEYALKLCAYTAIVKERFS